MNFRQRKRDAQQINLTPMIDVVFLLLIFFMVTTTFDTTGGIDIVLPEGTSQAQAETRSLQIAVTADGNYLLNGRELALADIAQQMQDRTYENLVVLADERARHGAVVSLMERARAQGITRISVATTAPRN